MTRIDLNSDMGEGYGVYSLGDDAAMLDIVTSANIACGFHAGDPLVMHKTLSEAHGAALRSAPIQASSTYGGSAGGRFSANARPTSRST